MPTAHDRRQSTDPSFRVIDMGKMTRFVDQYNNAFHSAIQCTPSEMFNSPELEKAYIFEQMRRRQVQQHINDFKLKRGMYVRYRLPRDGFAKKRSQYSLEQYPITDVKGDMYTLTASDGTQKLFPRFRLIMASKDGSANVNYKVAQTFGH